MPLSSSACWNADTQVELNRGPGTAMGFPPPGRSFGTAFYPAREPARNKAAGGLQKQPEELRPSLASRWDPCYLSCGGLIEEPIE
jgi:hypothetical protein